MARTDVLSILYAKKKSLSDFDWDKLVSPPMRSIISDYDISLIENINRDPTLISEPKRKKKYIDDILVPRGLVRFAAGTNRVVYKYLEDQSILFKIAVSQPGLTDSPREFYNQNYLKPFVTKCFEVSPFGSIGLFERVETINTYEQYMGVADDHFNLLDTIFGSGKYIMEDVGSKFWRNIGIRTGFGVVLVDYPMLIELDGNKLFCKNRNPFTGLPCGGQIDVDEGYNHVFCTKCGLQYMGSDLARKIRDNEIIVRKEKGTNMKMIINYNGQEKISDSYTGCSTYLDTSRNTENKNTAPVNTSGVIRVTNNWNEIKEMRKQEEQKVEKAVETVHAKSTSAKVNFNKAKSLSNTILGTKVKNDHKEEKAEEVKIPITNHAIGANTSEKPFTASYTIGTIAGVKIDDIKGEEPKDVEKKDIEMSQEPVRESSLFGGIDSTMYQQEPYNPAKMSRQERRKNNKSKKEKREKKRSYTTNVHSSPVPRKGLNNMQYNMEEENEQEEVKQEKHNPVINNKLTHF